MDQLDELLMAEEVDKLCSRWNEFKNKIYIKRCFQHLADLSPNVVSDIVNTMLDNFRFCPLPKDFNEAVQAYKSAHSSFERTNSLLADQESRKSEISDQGLVKALNLFGANSLLDAISKSTKGKRP